MYSTLTITSSWTQQ